MGRALNLEPPRRHGEDPARTEPCVVVHGLDIGTVQESLHTSPRAGRTRPGPVPGPGDSESPYRASQGPSRGPCPRRRRGRFGAIPERSTRRHNEPILRKAPETLGGIDHRRAPGVHGVGPPLRPRPSVLSGARPCGRLAALGPRAPRPGPEDPWGEPRARAGGSSTAWSSACSPTTSACCPTTCSRGCCGMRFLPRRGSASWPANSSGRWRPAAASASRRWLGSTAACSMTPPRCRWRGPTSRRCWRRLTSTGPRSTRLEDEPDGGALLGRRDRRTRGRGAVPLSSPGISVIGTL